MEDSAGHYFAEGNRYEYCNFEDEGHSQHLQAEFLSLWRYDLHLEQTLFVGIHYPRSLIEDRERPRQIPAGQARGHFDSACADPERYGLSLDASERTVDGLGHSSLDACV